MMEGRDQKAEFEYQQQRTLAKIEAVDDGATKKRIYDKTIAHLLNLSKLAGGEDGVQNTVGISFVNLIIHAASQEMLGQLNLSALFERGKSADFPDQFTQCVREQLNANMGILVGEIAKDEVAINIQITKVLLSFWQGNARSWWNDVFKFGAVNEIVALLNFVQKNEVCRSRLFEKAGSLATIPLTIDSKQPSKAVKALALFKHIYQMPLHVTQKGVTLEYMNFSILSQGFGEFIQRYGGDMYIANIDDKYIKFLIQNEKVVSVYKELGAAFLTLDPAMIEGNDYLKFFLKHASSNELLYKTDSEKYLYKLTQDLLGDKDSPYGPRLLAMLYNDSAYCMVLEAELNHDVIREESRQWSVRYEQDNAQAQESNQPSNKAKAVSKRDRDKHKRQIAIFQEKITELSLPQDATFIINGTISQPNCSYADKLKQLKEYCLVRVRDHMKDSSQDRMVNYKMALAILDYDIKMNNSEISQVKKAGIEEKLRAESVVQIQSLSRGHTVRSQRTREVEERDLMEREQRRGKVYDIHELTTEMVQSGEYSAVNRINHLLSNKSSKAVKIQSLTRGHRVRNERKQQTHERSLMHQEEVLGKVNQVRDMATNLVHSIQNDVVLKVDNVVADKANKVVQIQSAMRSKLARGAATERRTQKGAAVKIQSVIRRHIARNDVDRIKANKSKNYLRIISELEEKINELTNFAKVERDIKLQLEGAINGLHNSQSHSLVNARMLTTQIHGLQEQISKLASYNVHLRSDHQYEQSLNLQYRSHIAFLENENRLLSDSKSREQAQISNIKDEDNTALDRRARVITSLVPGGVGVHGEEFENIFAQLCKVIKSRRHRAILISEYDNLFGEIDQDVLDYDYPEYRYTYSFCGQDYTFDRQTYIDTFNLSRSHCLDLYKAQNPRQAFESHRSEVMDKIFTELHDNDIAISEIAKLKGSFDRVLGLYSPIVGIHGDRVNLNDVGSSYDDAYNKIDVREQEESFQGMVNHPDTENHCLKRA